MSKMIQLRNVPDSLHAQLKSRAALAGMSLSDYLIREARKIAERPSSNEILTRLSRRTPISPTISPANAVRKERDAR
jgi:plasmid stability protein